MEYLLLSKHRTHGIALWWRPGGCGYTTDINEAGRFDKEEAERIAKDSHGDDVPVPVEAIGNTITTRTIVDIGDANNHGEIMRFEVV